MEVSFHPVRKMYMASWLFYWWPPQGIDYVDVDDGDNRVGSGNCVDHQYQHDHWHDHDHDGNDRVGSGEDGVGEEGADQEEGEAHLDNDDNPLIIRCTLISIMLIIPMHLDNDNVDNPHLDNLLQISTLTQQSAQHQQT